MLYVRILLQWQVNVITAGAAGYHGGGAAALVIALVAVLSEVVGVLCAVLRCYKGRGGV